MRLILAIGLFFFTLACSAQAPFISTWKTDNSGSSNDLSITIPTIGTGYRYDIDWESDGIYDDLAVSGNITHEYDKVGTYTVSIRGDFHRIYFNNSGDKLKILSIEQWGDNVWSSMASAFNGASNLTINTEDPPNLSFATDMSLMFRNASSINTSLNDWEVGTITNMTELFRGASSFNGSIGSWDVENVSSMSSMFRGASSFNRSLENWNVGNVNSMSSMFLGASSFNHDLGLWDISNVITMSGMLSNTGLSQQNYESTLLGWSNQNVQSDVIFGASGLSYCAGENARSILEDTYSWNITGDTKACYFHTTWKTDNSGPSNNNSIQIPVVNGASYNYDIDWNNDGIFEDINVSGTITHTYSSPGTYEVAIRGDFPGIFFNNQGDKEKIISIDQWGDQEWESLENAFWGCQELIYNAQDEPDLSSITSLQGIFRNCINVNANFGNWDILDIVDMTTAFDNTSISIVNYDSTLFAWANKIHQPNLDIGVIGLEYCLSEFVRNDLINDGWNFNSDSKNCNGVVRPLVITIQTDLPGSTGNQQFRIPVYPSIGQFDYDVDWNNDGIYEDRNNSLSRLHTFSSPGTYRVAIRGDFPRIYFNNEDDAQKITSIDQWGDQVWASMENSFQGCSNLNIKASDSPNLSEVESMTRMFFGASSLNADLNAWDVSNVRYMDWMFTSADAFNSDLSSWQVGNVELMNSMFQNADAFDRNLGNWNISSVTNMFNMLSNTNLSIDNYDNTLIGWASQSVNSGHTLSATGLQYCAGEDARDILINTHNWNIEGDRKGCNYFITTWKTDNQGISDPTSVTIPTADFNDNYNYDIDWNNDGVFDDIGVTGGITHDYGVSGIYTIAIRGDFPHFYMNGEGDSLKLIRLDQWGDIQWESFASSFEGASNMTYAAVDTPILNSVISMTNTFKDATLFNGDLKGWDLSSVQQMVGMFENAISFNGDISDWQFDRLFNMNNMFKGATSFNRDIGSWELDTVRLMASVFEGATSFNQDISEWDVADVETMSRMFKGATMFNQDIGNWNVSKVESMFNMFNGASSFNQDLNLWDVELVGNMGAMFRDAIAFNGDISEWQVNNASSMSSMFRNAKAFNQDISSWTPNSVISMSFMFREAIAFNQNLGDWLITEVTDMNEMLSLSGMSISNYDNTLIGWSNKMVQPNVTLIASALEYCLGEDAREDLMMNHGWTFLGDSKNCTVQCGDIINTWIGSSSGNWNDSASDWSVGEIPDLCHQVIIPIGKIITVQSSQTAECYLLDVHNGGELIISNGAILKTSDNNSN